MKQMAFTNAEHASKRKQPRKAPLLLEMDQMVPWSGSTALIEQHHPKGEGSIRPIR